MHSCTRLLSNEDIALYVNYCSEMPLSSSKDPEICEISRKSSFAYTLIQNLLCKMSWNQEIFRRLASLTVEVAIYIQSVNKKNKNPIQLNCWCYKYANIVHFIPWFESKVMFILVKGDQGIKVLCIYCNKTTL